MIYNDIINYSKGWNAVSDKTKMEKQDVYRGETGRVLLGEACDKNDLLYPVLTALGTVAEWKQSNANSAATMPARAIALEGGADGQRIRVLFGGYIKDKDFNYGTLATGTIVLSGTVTEGDKIILGDKLKPYCLMFTAAAGTSALTKIAATSTLSTTGIGVNAEIFTIDDVVFECSTDGVIESTSDYMVDLQVSTAQGTFETAIEDALDQAIADKRLDISYVAFTGNDCVITLGGTDDSYVGLEMNDVVSTEDCTNASFAAVTFLGGVPAVDFEMAGTLTIAAAKVLLTAGIVSAIAAGLDITQAAWATNDLVLTAGEDFHRGYKGNNLQMAEVDLAGTLDAGSNLAVGATAFAGGVEGGVLYAAPAKGLLTLTKPTVHNFVQPVGFAIEAEKFFFNPQPVELAEGAAAEIASVAGASATGTGGIPPQTRRWTDPMGTIITQITVDLTGMTSKGTTAKDAIGLAGAGVCYIGKYTAADFGYVFKSSMSCIELPVMGSGTTITLDIDLGSEDGADITQDDTVDDVVIDGGTMALGLTVEDLSWAVPEADYFYIIEGAGIDGVDCVYSAGQIVFTFYGKPAMSA